MLAKKFKLPIEAFLKEKGKKRFDLPLFTAFIRPNDLAFNRVGVTLSAKAERKAVRRHEVSRRIFRASRGWPQKGLDINIVGHAPLFGATGKDIEAELKRFTASALSSKF
jgi:ribonuclease P protein component